MHFFQDNEVSNLNKNADISIFPQKEGKDVYLQIPLEFAFIIICRNSNTFIKILKLHGKWQHKIHFGHVLNNKIVVTALKHL